MYKGTGALYSTTYVCRTGGTLSGEPLDLPPCNAQHIVSAAGVVAAADGAGAARALLSDVAAADAAHRLFPGGQLPAEEVMKQPWTKWPKDKEWCWNPVGREELGWLLPVDVLAAGVEQLLGACGGHDEESRAKREVLGR